MPSVSSDSRRIVADLTMKVRKLFGFGFVSLSIQLETENGYFGYNQWHTTDVLLVVLSINSPIDGDTSIEAPSMEVWGKRRRKKMKDRKEKRKEAKGYFCPNSIFGVLKHELLKWL